MRRPDEPPPCESRPETANASASQRRVDAYNWRRRADREVSRHLTSLVLQTCHKPCYRGQTPLTTSFATRGSPVQIPSAPPSAVVPHDRCKGGSRWNICSKWRGLVHRYGDHTALAGVDLTVESGECVALLGPNGAGKTTLVRNVMGLIEGNADLIEVAGGNPRSAEVRRRLGVVQQAVGFPRSLTVGEIVGGAAARRGCPPEAASQAIAEMGLAGLEKRRAAELSGGQQQRLQLAMGLVADPVLLVLDSPSGAAGGSSPGPLVHALHLGNLCLGSACPSHRNRPAFELNHHSGSAHSSSSRSLPIRRRPSGREATSRSIPEIACYGSGARL